MPRNRTPASSSSLQSMTEWRKFKALQQKQHLFSDSQVSRKFQFLPYAIIWNLSALRIWCVAASRWIIPLHPQPLKKRLRALAECWGGCNLFPCEIYHCKSLSIKSLSLLSAEEILALDWLLSPKSINMNKQLSRRCARSGQEAISQAAQGSKI